MDLELTHYRKRLPQREKKEKFWASELVPKPHGLKNSPIAKNRFFKTFVRFKAPRKYVKYNSDKERERKMEQK